MVTIKTFEQIDDHRRDFVLQAAATIAAVGLDHNPAQAQSGKTGLSTIRPGSNTSFAQSSRSMPARSASDTLMSDPLMALRSFFCTAGHTISTPMLMSPRCWQRRETG